MAISEAPASKYLFIFIHNFSYGSSDSVVDLSGKRGENMEMENSWTRTHNIFISTSKCELLACKAHLLELQKVYSEFHVNKLSRADFRFSAAASNQQKFNYKV